MTGQGTMTGKVFGGRYEIKDRIGIGGMAEVYRAQDSTLGRVVAVKVMLPQFAADPSFTQRFRQAPAAAANLQSPYIVNVYDWGQDDDTYYIVMEFVRGSDLKTAIQQRGAINQRKAAEIGAQVCQALTEGKVDIGFCSKIYSDPQLEYAPILRRSMVAAVPLDHPLAQQSSVTLEDTLPYPHVTYSWLSGQRDPVEALFAPVRDRWRIAYEVEDANFILELVAQGFGITVLLDTPPVHRPDVKVLPLTQPVQMGDFYIVRRKPPHPLANVDRFFDFCVEQARHPAQDLPPVSLPASPAE